MIIGPAILLGRHLRRPGMKIVVIGGRGLIGKKLIPLLRVAFIDDILALGDKRTPLALEQVLTRARLPLIRQHVKKKTLIYTYYIDGIDRLLRDALIVDGWTVDFFTGDPTPHNPRRNDHAVATVARLVTLVNSWYRLFLVKGRPPRTWPWRVRVCLVLQPGVSFQSTSQLPDQSGPNLAWNLGPIQGFDRASVSLTVSLTDPLPLQLDTGAHAFDTLNAGAVRNDTPAALRPGAVSPDLLASTPDANITDPFIQEQAAMVRVRPARNLQLPAQ
jgi:hypothetical protein